MYTIKCTSDVSYSIEYTHICDHSCTFTCISIVSLFFDRYTLTHLYSRQSCYPKMWLKQRTVWPADSLLLPVIALHHDQTSVVP